MIALLSNRGDAVPYPPMPPYPLSFTAAALLPRESVITTEGYLDIGDWGQAQQRIVEEDRFGYRKPATTRRIFRELALRLETLSRTELELLISGSADTVRLLLWQACCRAYPFIGNFALQVLRQKLAVYDYQLREVDYRQFLRQESENHPKLEELAESTLTKLRSRLYAILQEVGILRDSKTGELQPPFVPDSLRTCVPAPRVTYLKYWLLPETEVEPQLYDRA